MKSTIRRLLFAVVAIAMAMPSFAFKLNDVFSVKGEDGNTLLYQITNANLSNLEVSVNAPRDASTGNNLTPENPVVVVPAEVDNGFNYRFKVTGIGRFGGTKITSITVPEGVKKLDEGCFSRCTELAEVKLPSTIETIGANPFGNCGKLTNVEFTNGNTHFVLDDGVLYSADHATLYYYPMNKEAEEFTVNSATTTILAGTFASHPSLKKLILPKGLTSFDPSATTMVEQLVEYAMEDNEGDKYSIVDGLLCETVNGKKTLTSFPYAKAAGANPYIMPAGIQIIGKRAFDSNQKLSSIKFTGVETIDDEAFFRCNNLQEVTIPVTTISVKSSSFADCGKLRNIFVEGGNVSFWDEDGVLFRHMTTDNETSQLKVLYIFPVAHMKSDDYTDDGLSKTYEVPEGTNVIYSSAFQSCSVGTVKLPSSVEEIGNDAFKGGKLTQIELNEGLAQIGTAAFQSANLQSVSIPSSVKTLGAYSFYRMPEVTEIKIAANSQLTSIPSLTFSNNVKLETFMFEGNCDNVKSIEMNAFENCTSLKSFTIPASVTTIGTGAFSGCSSLANVTFAEGATIQKIGSNSFQHCTGLKEITIPNSVTNIEYEAFNDCQNLKTIHIPANTTSINQGAFSLCGNLTKFDVDDNNQQYSCVDGMLTSKDKKTLCIFPGGKANDEITLLSPSFTAIGERAFYYCKKLTNVTIPKHVTKIGNEAFRMCDNLKTIAFLGDTPIEEENIGTDAFTPQTGDKTILDNCENFFVRKDNINAYKSHRYWGTWADKMKTSFENGTEEYFPMSDKAVSLLKTTSTNYTLVVPATVSNEADGKTYSVSMLGDYAFENADNRIKEVVLLGNINYIGACAFDKTQRSGTQVVDEASTPQQILNIFFTGRNQAGTELSTVRFGLNDEGATSLPEFVTGQNIYVRKSVYQNAEDTWGTYKSQLKYQIPLTAVGTELTTLSREFDVDLSENNWDEANNQPYVIAFTSGYKHLVTDYVKDNDGKPVKGDDGQYKTNEYYLIHMESVNVNNGEDGVQGNGNGTFIPKNTGVLIKDMSKSGKLTNFTYQIYDGENDLSADDVNDNLMQSVVLNDGTMQTGDYGLGSDNLLHQYKGTNGRKVNVHESYMRLPAEAQEAKLQLTFEGFGETTGIDDVKVADDAQEGDDAYYTLEGMKVAQPTHGIYIHNGKKIVLK